MTRGNQQVVYNIDLSADRLSYTSSIECALIHAETEIATLNAEIGDLEAKLESECDLMELRRLAMEELGMVEGSFVKMDYLSLETPEDIQSFSEKQSREISFAAILSAIGWLK